MPVDPRYRPEPRHTELGRDFYDVVSPAAFPAPSLRFRNGPWASAIGLGDLSTAEWQQHFAQLEPLPDNLKEPLALRYHGHQFRHYNAQLGDGRGFLLAQLRGPQGRLLDLGTKGSGTTPYSRGGDGRLTLLGGVREVLAAELLEAHGVPTSKILSLFETGEHLYRHDEPSPTRGAVMVRLSHSHIRFGTFQRAAYNGNRHGLDRLLQHCVTHHYPALADADDLPVAFLRAVTGRMAEMVAGYTTAGFVHGVLNTDNMNICGESFDYGPWRFLPTLDLDFIAAYFDGDGLYRFGRQPAAVMWNLTQLAQSLSPLGDRLRLSRTVNEFEPLYHAALTRRFVARLGLSPLGQAADEALVRACFAFLDGHTLSYDRFFFDWYGGMDSYARAMRSPAAAAYTDKRFRPVMAALAGWSMAHPERLADPFFQRSAPISLRNDVVHALWETISSADQWEPLTQCIHDIRDMGRMMGHTLSEDAADD